MSIYYELVKNKNTFLNYLIDKYCENPKEGKRNFILAYLKTCSLFKYNPWMIIEELKGKHYCVVQTYIDEDDYVYAYFEESNFDEIVRQVERQNKYEDYKIDYIQINIPSKNKFIFTVEEYKANVSYIEERYIKDETWIENNQANLISVSSLIPKIKELNAFYSSDDNAKVPNKNYIDMGINPKEVIVFAGQTNVGKTALAINAAIKEIENDGKVLYMTLNNRGIELARRILCAKYRVSFDQLNWCIDNNQEENLLGLSELEKIKLCECCHYNIKEIEKVINKNSFKPTMVIIDGFGAIHYKENYPKTNEEIEYIAQKLKSLAKKLNISIIVTSNVSNKRSKRLADIVLGTKLSEIADKVYMLYRKTNDNSDLPFETMKIKDVKEKKTILCSFEKATGIIEKQ